MLALFAVIDIFASARASSLPDVASQMSPSRRDVAMRDYRRQESLHEFLAAFREYRFRRHPLLSNFSTCLFSMPVGAARGTPATAMTLVFTRVFAAAEALG